MTNSSRPKFGPTEWKCKSAKKGSKKTGFRSKRMIKIAKDYKRSQAYMQQPKERRNSNGNTRNDDTNRIQTRVKKYVSSKVASKEIPKTLERKKNISSAEISNKARNVGKLTQTPRVKKYVSSKVASKEILKTLERKKNISSAEISNKATNVGKLCDAKVNNASKSSKALASTSSGLHMLSPLQGRRSVASSGRKQRNKGKATQGHNHLGKKSLPSYGKDLPRDGRDDGLRMSNHNHKKSTPEHINKIKLHERNLEGCGQQGRIAHSLVGEEDDVDGSHELKSIKERIGQMPKKRKTNANDVSEDLEHLTSNDSMPKKKYRGLDANEDIDVGSQNFGYVKDGNLGVFMPTISEAIKGNCSLPIDEPIWSGIFKIGSKEYVEYVSLAGHLSTKSCEKVCMLSRSLRPVVNVTKHSMLEVWHGSLEISGSTDENIGLFFFPNKMRPDENVDQLVKEVMENDLALCAVIGETEMLIFPSIMLPRQYQTFQGKHYLWGLFRPRKDVVGVVEEQAAHAMSPMKHAMRFENQEGFKDGIEQVEFSCIPEPDIDSEPQDPERANEEQVAHAMSSMDHAMRLENREGFKDGTEQVEFSRVPEPNMDIEPQDPQGGKMQDAADQNLAPTLGGSNASLANQPSIAATVPANHEQINSSLGIPQGRVFAFVAQPSRRFEELMQELERDGALIGTMPRVTTGPGQPGHSNGVANVLHFI